MYFDCRMREEIIYLKVGEVLDKSNVGRSFGSLHSLRMTEGRKRWTTN